MQCVGSEISLVMIILFFGLKVLFNLKLAQSCVWMNYPVTNLGIGANFVRNVRNIFRSIGSRTNSQLDLISPLQEGTIVHKKLGICSFITSVGTTRGQGTFRVVVTILIFWKIFKLNKAQIRIFSA